MKKQLATNKLQGKLEKLRGEKFSKQQLINIASFLGGRWVLWTHGDDSYCNGKACDTMPDGI